MKTTTIIITVLSLTIIGCFTYIYFLEMLIKDFKRLMEAYRQQIKMKDEYILQLEKTKKAKPGFLEQIFDLLTVGAIFQKEQETIEEQFKRALENEDYRLAAKLRDQLNKKNDAQSN